jgi:eukaryotic-like serine/threonine-protein kinase
MPDEAASLPLTVHTPHQEPPTPIPADVTPLAPDTVNDPNRTGPWQPQPDSADTRALPDVPGFVLEKELGRGGMGVVYRARQMPLNRTVALKMILAGDHASTEAKTRFLAEAEAIAKLRHPGIVQVHEYGTHQGHPYFALEFLDGGSLDRVLAQGPLVPPDAARLVAQLADAMQAAHQAGIIHRDLKPANVLLAFSRAPQARATDSPALTDATTKITDFGLAKQIDAGPGLTASGAIMGTPSYMAPEQAAGTPPQSPPYKGGDGGVGPTTDVYALGAILYECLTGRPPFRAATVFDTLDMVLRQEPVPVRQLQPTAPKDLETICHKCLQKEQGKRYASAAALAEDLRNYLDGKPITARPVGPMERTWKWCRRYPAVAALVVVSTLAAMVASGLAWWALRAEGAATTAAANEKAANELTTERLKQIELINNSVFDIFEGFDMRRVKAGPYPVEYVLAQHLIDMGKKLDAKAIHDPLVLASLQNRLGRTLLSLGRHQEAIDFLTAARDTRQTQLGHDHDATLSSMGILASAYQGAGNLELALPLFEENLKHRKATLGPDHLDTLTSMSNLAGAYLDVGKLDLALPLFEETLKRIKATLGPDHPHTLATMGNLAEGYQGAGKVALAVPLYEETLKRMKATLGPDHFDTFTCMGKLADSYRSAGKLDLALPLYEETLKRIKAKLGPDHPHTLSSMGNLALGYRDAGQLDLALPLMEETLKHQNASLGLDHPDTLTSMSNL